MNRKLRIITKTIFGVLLCWGLIISPFYFLIILADYENKLNVGAIVDTLNFILKYWYIFGCVFVVLFISISAYLGIRIFNEVLNDEKIKNRMD